MTTEIRGLINARLHKRIGRNVSDSPRILYPNFHDPFFNDSRVEKA